MPDLRVNHQIKAPQLRLIDESGANVGVLAIGEALKFAEERWVDLIEISPTAVPPVAKLMNFGKFQYLENKRARQAKGHSHTTETKTIQVKIGTGDHDLEIKAAKVSDFLKEGHRAKIDLFLPGRAKYLNSDFLKERLERLLKFVTTEYKIADPAKKSPKGLTIVLEKAK